MNPLPKSLSFTLTLFVMVLVVRQIVEMTRSQPPQQTISVQGVGEVSATPDVATLFLSIISEAGEATRAQNQNSEKSNALISMLDQIGVPKEDIQTTQYSLEPIYSYPENRPPQLNGFRLSQTLTVKVRKFDLLGKILAESVQLGVNHTEGPVFEISNPDQLRSEARKKAFMQARGKAESMTQAAGVRLGRMISFTEGGTPSPISYRTLSAPKESDGYTPPAIEAGSQDLSVTVDCVYEIR